jgi:hypothetical protein
MPAQGPPPRPAARAAEKLRTPKLLLLVRYVLPAAIILAGAIAVSFGTEDSLYGGVSLIGAGLSVALLNWVYRIGVRGDADRADEDQARRYFDRFGRWPDERR